MKRRPPLKIRLTVCGVRGRMGARIIALAAQDPRFQLIAGVEKPAQGRHSNSKLARFTIDGRAPIVPDLAEVLPKTDAVIDFTEPGAALQIAQRAAQARCALIIGTTGISPSARKRLERLAKRIPI